MTLSSVMTSGTSDFNFVLTTIFSGLSLQLIGCTIEQSKHQWKVLLSIGVLIELSISWSLFWYTVSSRNISQYQWIETISFLFYYGFFPLNCILDATYRKNSFIATDWMYNVLSLSSKFALFWLQVGEVERAKIGGLWPDIQIYTLGIISPFIVLCFGIYYIPKKSVSKAEMLPTNLVWKLLYFIATLQILSKPKPEKIYIKQKGRLRS